MHLSPATMLPGNTGKEGEADPYASDGASSG